ncbi:NusA antitermination factor [Denitrovibrio acetiphilus DSM 12809]|uniref:Transcription termination/antitermination protein NusA n=1 Tax=Denitrovibrio acetiphilus (strain DSM 12809 / NBRC 114555 / N2460) TaxID=522772 RepID=D4H7W7_DENA2|nr:transcription termination factor NusA [Denitrovibrio acetiphilus]ADD68116.1 NusA antitermination factor [Denitrovibrio acetiphilus DSM 12809]
MSKELTKVVDEIGREKGIARELLQEALEESIFAAVARKIGKLLEPDVFVDIDKGTIEILLPKEVCESVDDKWTEIHIDNADEFKENPQLGDVIMVPATLEELGRQAALVAKQKLFEKLRDAEKQVVLDQFQDRIGEIVNGVVLKTDRDNLIINIGKTEAVLPKREMIGGDFFNRGDYVRALLLDIRIIKGWPQLILSRTHPEFMKKLFETEIPEVFEGIIDVKAVSREPGDRAKVAVYTTNSSIDPVGACIGLKGVRINAISNELRGEKIDVIEWSPDSIKFVCNAISPAEVVLTNIFEDEETIEIVVPDDQLSLAIGKKGQNVRLAAKLTEWRLDVLKESEYAEIRKERMQDQEQDLKEFYEMYNLDNLEGLDADTMHSLIEAGYDDIEKLSNADFKEVAQELECEEEKAVSLINMALDYLANKFDELEDEIEEAEEAADTEEKEETEEPETDTDTEND